MMFFQAEVVMFFASLLQKHALLAILACIVGLPYRIPAILTHRFPKRQGGGKCTYVEKKIKLRPVEFQRGDKVRVYREQFTPQGAKIRFGGLPQMQLICIGSTLHWPFDHQKAEQISIFRE